MSNVTTAPNTWLPRTRQGWVAAGILGVAGLVLGVAAGRTLAYGLSKDSLYATFSIIIYGGGLLVLSLVILVAAGVAWFVGRRHPSPIAAVLVAVAALLPMGALAGAATAAATGGTYHPPVTLEAPGTLRVTFEPPIAGFVPEGSNVATCESTPDTHDVAGIAVPRLGTIAARPLRLDLVVGSEGPGTVTAVFSLAAESGSGLIDSNEWAGLIRVSDLAGLGVSGSGTFAGLGRSNPADKPGIPAVRPDGPEPSAGRATDIVPTTLSGTVNWSCGAWD